MSNFAELAEMDLADGSNPMFLVRWRGRQEGPYPACVIEAKLAAHEIGLLHEIFHHGQWVTIEKFIADKETVLQAQRQAQAEQEQGTFAAAQQDNPQSDPRLVSCSCQYCNGHIEFDASDFGKGETRNAPCPHCGLETVLFAPASPTPVIAPPVIAAVALKKQTRIITLVAIAIVAIPLAIITVTNFAIARSKAADRASGKWSTNDIVRNGNVQVAVNNLSRGAVLQDNGEGLGVTPLQGTWLHISIVVFNGDSKMKMDFNTWRGSATLSDEHGNRYKQIVPDRWHRFWRLPADSTSIYPGSPFIDHLIFELPTGAAKKLHLELPADNFGGRGYVRFKIPTERILND